MADDIIKVKNTILDFVTDNLKLEFDEYIQDSQVYWEYSAPNMRSNFPYTILSTMSDNTLGYATHHGYRVEGEDPNKVIYKIEKQFNVLTVRFETTAMRGGSLSSYEAQNLAQRSARHLRRLLKSDASLSWFGYNNNDDISIGVESQNISEVDYSPTYEDTKGCHKYVFSCPFNWQETFETEVNMAQAAKVNINEEIDIVISKD